MRDLRDGMNRAWIAASWLGALALSSGCSGINKQLEGPPPPPPPQAGTIGVRHLDQLSLSMSAVTGVPMSSGGNPGSPVDANGNTYSDSNGTITFAGYNQEILPWLSPDGNANSVTAGMLLSATGSAGLYCSTMLFNESQSLNILSGTGVVFSKGSAGLTPSVVAAVINQLANQFWRRAPTSAETQILTQSVTDAIAGLQGGNNPIPDPSSQATQTVLLVPCTVALSSIAFLSI
jgi:hypothetical protein